MMELRPTHVSDPKVGRFISEDPIGFSGGINFYGYAGANPTTRMDPSGLWSPTAHDFLFDTAFNGYRDVTPDEIDIMAQWSRQFDKATQAGECSHMHSMRQHGQSREDAIRKRINFIRERLAFAKFWNDEGNRIAALKVFAEAAHAIQDFTSPLHTDSEGNPKEWNIWKEFLTVVGVDHTWMEGVGREGARDLTDEIVATNAKYMHAAYDQVFR